MGKNLQAALERARTPAPAGAAASGPGKGGSGREGKVHIGAYLNADFKKSLMLVRAQTGQDVQTLIAQALNDLFRAHNVPVVDHN